MPRKSILDPSERAVIKELWGLGFKQCEIAVKLKRSRCIISTFLNDPEKYGSRNYSLKRRKIDERGIRVLVREAEKGEKSSKELVGSLKLGISARHTRRLLCGVGGLKFYKLKRNFGLTPRHKRARVKFARDSKAKMEDIRRTIFTDYTKFTLEGPLNLRSGSWRRPGAPVKKAGTYVKRGLAGRRGYMVWGGVSLMGKTELAFVDGNQDAAAHVNTLANHLVPFIDLIEGLVPGFKFIFQQDNASIHTAGTTKSWLQQQTFEVLEWPAKSPDLNPIENAWAELARKVYDHGRKQYDSLEPLKVAIEKAWDDLDMGYIESLFKSLPKRFDKCIRAQGDKINY